MKENHLINRSSAVRRYNYIRIILLYCCRLDGRINIIMDELFDENASAINYSTIWQLKISNGFDI